MGTSAATRDLRTALKGGSNVARFRPSTVPVRLDDVVRCRLGILGLPITDMPRGEETAVRILTLRTAFFHSCRPAVGVSGVGGGSFSVGELGALEAKFGSIEMGGPDSDVLLLDSEMRSLPGSGEPYVSWLWLWFWCPLGPGRVDSRSSVLLESLLWDNSVAVRDLTIRIDFRALR